MSKPTKLNSFEDLRMVLPATQKYLRIENMGKGEQGNDVYMLYSKQSGKQLATVVYHTPWRKWAMMSLGGILFDNNSLQEIINFLNRLNKQ